MPLPFATRYQIPAAEVRTGMVIQTAYSRMMRPDRSLEVAYPIHNRFTNPEGETMHRIRYAGWHVQDDERFGWTDGSYNEKAAALVWVVEDMRDSPLQDRPRSAGDTFKVLTTLSPFFR